MKKNIYLILLLFIIQFGYAQCPTGNNSLVFTNQANIDNFIINYPNCTHLQRSILISGGGITNLNGLQNLQIVDGNLSISSTSLNDLSSLENITRIEGNLSIRLNQNLTAINVLDELEFIGGELYIYNNQYLTIVNFNNLKSISTNVVYNTFSSISNNPLLQELSMGSLLMVGGESNFYTSLNINNNPLLHTINLANLDSVHGNFGIFNSGISNLEGLSSLKFIGRSFNIKSNTNLTSFEGLDSIESVNDQIIIESNPNLTSITELENVNMIGVANLSIFNNPNLAFCGYSNFCGYLSNPNNLRNIHSNALGCEDESELIAECFCPIGDYTFTTQQDINEFAATYSLCQSIKLGSVVIGNESGLSDINDLTSLYNLSDISGNLRIQNTQLVNLEGLESLNRVNWNLRIRNNPYLTNISSLHNLNYISTNAAIGLEITNNPLLETCHLPNFCIFLSNSNNPRNISGNSSSCENETSLITACSLPCPTGDFTFTSQSEIDNFEITYTHCSNISLATVFIGSATELTDIDDLTPLWKLVSINGSLRIQNTQLQNLNGLESVSNIQWNLRIINNPYLTDISAIDNANYTSTNTNIGLEIVDNPILEFCNYPSLCTYLSNSSNPRNIAGNTQKCENELALMTACITPLCGENFYDHGGPFGNYKNNANYSVTIFPDNSNEKIRVSFSSFALENGYDGLMIYDGPDINSPLIDSGSTFNRSTCPNGAWTGINQHSAEGKDFISTHSTGALTFVFTSDGSQSRPGWEASVHCETCIAPSILSVDNITSTSVEVNVNSVENAEGYQWYVFNSGEGPNNYPLLTGISTSTSFEINGLDSGKELDIYFKSNCGSEDGVSLFSEPVTITTKWCGGKFYDSGGPSEHYNLGEDYTTTIYPENYNEFVSVTFDLFNIAISGDAGLMIYDGPNASSPIISSGSIYNTIYSPNGAWLGNAEYSPQGLTFTSSHPSGALTFKFRSNPNFSFSIGEPFGWEATVDCLSCDDIQPGLEIINVTAINARLKFNPGISYDIEWGPSGFTQGSGTQQTGITTQFYDLIGLQSDTIYDVYIRHNCLGSQTDWMQFSFSTVLCPSGNLMIYDQLDVDEFIINYPDCTQINGNLDIVFGDDITNLDGLSNIETVLGRLEIWELPYLDNFNGLSNLQSVGGFLRIKGILSITNLDGLSNLQNVAGSINIYDNPNLNDIYALQGIDYLSISNLLIQNNPQLSICNLPNFCQYLSEYRPSNISGNLGDCFNLVSVQNACFYQENCDSHTIWNGTTWSNGMPDNNKAAVIQGNLTVTSSLNTCELYLNSGILNIAPGAVLTVKGKIVNNQNADKFIVQNDGVLLQIENVDNMGEVKLVRNSSPMKRLDYTLWSAPVSGMLLKNFSDVSPSGGYGTLWNRVYTLGETSWNQVWLSQEAYQSDQSQTFENAQGYLYRSRNDYDSVITTIFEGEFIGIPNNGIISVEVPFLFNAIGNPYPSPINAHDLLSSGANALYFWTNTNVPVEGNYTLNNWAAFNTIGGINAANSDKVPDGIIQTGQGFVIGFETVNYNREVVFDNSMRLSEHNGQFFRQMNEEKHRFWLNLSDEEVIYNQILIGYLNNATQGFDVGMDARMFTYDGNAIYSIIEGEEDKFVIQGRTLPFTASDVVPIGFKALNAGNYTISLDSFDGYFESDDLTVYLKDNFTQVQHNLEESDYNFISEEGQFNNRFEVVYQTTMSVENSQIDYQNWIAYKTDNGFKITTDGFEMKEVSLYDMLGRKVYTSQVEGTSHNIPILSAEGIYIVKIITPENQILSKKVR